MKPCLDYALHYISRFPKTEKELIIQLRKKKYLEPEIESALKDLKKLNYVNDESFTRLYLGSEVARKGKPLYRVTSKLRQKGLEKDLVARIVEEMEEELNEGIFAKIRKEIDKLKLRGLEGVAIIQKLQSRGYQFSEIKKVVEAE